MTDDVEVKFLILHRVTIWDSAMPGSIVVVTNCGHRGWIAPSSRAWLAGEGADAYIICTACVGIMPPDDLEARTVPGAKREWQQHFQHGPDFEKNFQAFLRTKWRL